MIKERYVNFEVAKLLRDKGFDEECYMVYYINDESLSMGGEVCNSKLTHIKEIITAPTQAMACDWVEETFNIVILLDITILGYIPCFLNGHKDFNIASTAVLDGKDYMPMPVGDNSDGSWSSKELAYNEALKYVLINLI